MSNHLENGTVLPHGLLGVGQQAMMGAFNKAYKNTSLRMGIVVASYAYNDPNNYTKLTTEYDVMVLEQNENSSCTNQRYRNCLGSEGMGCIADFFEKNLRPQTVNNNPSGGINTANQDGAIVILLCLDSFTQKAVIISGLTHPDRQTKLTTTAPQLYGEYNGVAVAVNPDGSTSLTFNGATDNQGNPTNSSQGTTIFQIETDGSYKFTNSSVTIEGTKAGQLNITCSGAANITSQGNTTVTSQGDSIVNSQGNIDITSSGKITIKASEIDLNGSASGITTSNSHFGVVDFITGIAVMPSTTTFGDI